MAQKRFHRHFETPGKPLYWIILAYIALAWFFPVIGLIAIICMIGPVLTSIWKGRWWCGHVCPRGNMYDRLLSRYSPHRPIPQFVRTFGFRLFMVIFIFTMFGLQLTLTVTFQALGKSVSAMLITLGRQLIFYVPLLLVLPDRFGLTGFAFAQPAADILVTFLAVILSVSLFRHLRGMEAAGRLAGMGDRTHTNHLEEEIVQ